MVLMLCSALHSMVVQPESILPPKRINNLDDCVKEVLNGDDFFVKMVYSLCSGLISTLDSCSL